jgi:hypothetical protein
MGSFLLIRNHPRFKHRYSDFNNLHEKSLKIFENKNLELRNKIIGVGFILYLFHKLSYKIDNFFYFENDNFIASVGTLIYKGKTSKYALQELYKDFSYDKLNFSDLEGHFCVIFNRNNDIFIFNDFGGTYQVYHNIDYSFVSNSFLAISQALNEKTLSKQEVYEYIFYGTTYGNKTIYKEIELLDSKKIFRIYPNVEPINKKSDFKICEPNYSFNSLVDSIAGNLLDYFQTIKNNFGDDVCLGLSGGFDSRLILAALLSNKVTPIIYVLGEATSRDYQISKLISETENLTFENFRESQIDKFNEEDYLEFLNKKFFNIDGLNYNGIFLSIHNMDIINSKKAAINLNGGGGEIYRNFWTLPDKSISIKNFIKSKYDAIDFSICSDTFKKSEFFSCLENKIKILLGIEKDRLSSAEIQMLYPFWRLQFWTGRGISILNNYSYSLLPFSEPRFVFESSKIPLKFKTAGKFEASIIRKINKNLADYPSKYGHNFSQSIPFHQTLDDLIKIYTPIFLRPFLRRIKSKRNNPQRPYYMENEYLSKTLPSKEFYTSNFINVSSVTNIEILSRTLTMEYFLNRVSN